MKIAQTKRQRKSPKQYRDEHEYFILLMQEQRPALEIMDVVKLTAVQYKRHLLDALTLNEVSAYQPQYEAIKASSLPAIIVKNLGTKPESLVKIQKHDGGVLLSRLSAAPEREHEKTESDKHPNTH